MSSGKITSDKPHFVWLNVRTGAAILFALTFALFAPAIRYDYLQYDDGVYVYENAYVLKGLSVESCAYAFRTIDGGSWMPLTWLSLMLDQTVFGDHSWGHHLTNILLHSLCAALLFAVLYKLTGRFGASWFVAAAFAFHPLRTESVVWIAERKDVLSGVLWMLGILAYARYVERPSAKRVGLVLLCFVLGLMSKPMLVTFPFVLLLLDVWPLRRAGDDWKTSRSRFWPLVKEKAWLFAIVLMFCGLTFWSQDKSGAVSRPPSSVAEKISSVTANYGFYLQQTVRPANRTVLYPDVSDNKARNTFVVISIVGITILALVMSLRAPWFMVGWLWFVGTFVPVIGIVRIGYTTVADRYTYLPSIGLFIIIAWAAEKLIGKRIWFQRVVSTLAAVLIALMMFATRRDLPRWKDSGALFASAVNVSPHRVAWNNLAYYQIGRGEYAQAIESCNRAIEMNPEYGQSYGNRSLAYAWLDDYEHSKADYDHAVKLGTRPIQPKRNRVGIIGDDRSVPSINDSEEAWHLFAGLFKLEPKSAESFRGRADMRFKLRDVAGALSDYDKAIQLNANDPLAQTGRGNAHASSGNWLAALADLSKAIGLAPTNAASYQNRAVIHFKTGNYTQAWNDIDQCKKLGGTPHESFIRMLSEASGRKQ
jgi:tetratricopeptide (TPR) repeat protein